MERRDVTWAQQWLGYEKSITRKKWHKKLKFSRLETQHFMTAKLI